MIAKAKWFNSRKYTGWGLTPNCWQGWAYVAVAVAPMVILNQISFIDESFKMPLMLGWAMLFGIDLLDTMRKVPTDEREILHEALADRNALWFVLLVLTFGMAFKISQSVIEGQAYFDPVIMTALLGGTAVKAISHWYLKEK